MTEYPEVLMKKYLCGVDLGGTKLSAGLFSPDGTLFKKRKIYEHKSLDCDGIAESVIEIIKNLLNESGVKEEELYGIGIGVTGHINHEKGLIITSSNFMACFDDYPLRDIVSEKFNTRVLIDNDANAQAYGEFRFGAGRGFSDIIFVTVSTGVGCGIIVNRQLIRGMAGTAGEVGHTIIDPHSDIQCSCGNYGCLMSLSSGQYIPALYRKYLKTGMKSKLNMDLSSVDSMDGILLKKGLEIGDEISNNVINDSANAMGTGLYNLFQILNPEIFIIGGGLINIGESYIKIIEQKFLSLVKNMMHDRIEIKPTSLGNDAGLLGAAALTLE